MAPKIPKDSGSTPTPSLDKAVLAQGGGGVHAPLVPCAVAIETYPRGAWTQPFPTAVVFLGWPPFTILGTIWTHHILELWGGGCGGLIEVAQCHCPVETRYHNSGTRTLRGIIKDHISPPFDENVFPILLLPGNDQNPGP